MPTKQRSLPQGEQIAGRLGQRPENHPSQRLSVARCIAAVINRLDQSRTIPCESGVT